MDAKLVTKFKNRMIFVINVFLFVCVLSFWTWFLGHWWAAIIPTLLISAGINKMLRKLGLNQ